MRATWMVVCGALALSSVGVAEGPTPVADQTSGKPAGQPAARPALPADVETVLWWLPEDTETVLVSQGPLTVTIPPRDSPDVSPRALREQFQWNWSSMLAGQFVSQLTGRTLSLSVEGSRKFRAPRDLGLMPFEGCAVLLLQPLTTAAPPAAAAPGPSAAAPAVGTTESDSPADRAWSDTFLARLAARAKKSYSIAGHRVLLFVTKQEQDTWQYYVTMPRPNVLLVATNEKYLISVLYRMPYRRPARALPNSLPEWKQVDASARYWGLRHFNSPDAAHDPTSPLADGALAPNTGDRQAVGLVLRFDPDQSRHATVRYLSGNPRALQVASNLWQQPQEGLSPVVRQIEPGVVEIDANLDNVRTASMFVFVGMGVFGHAVFV